MRNMYLISATTENTLRVLQRIASLFSRYRVNIEQMNVFETGKKNISHFSIAVHTEEEMIEKLIKQLHRIVELIDVNISKQIPLD